ncbi:MAG: protein translocase subunit SecD [Hyphomicrobiales bacterium]|nr:protein translocase subunit SecD [Hyphomicrobiales bacterium]MCP5374414.1 protein translocase subunit SecD [Hyphomicrobiales bacterium]
MVYFAKWKMILVLAICALGVVFLAPNLISRQITDNLPDWIPHQRISLGLDLQGGSHLLLEVGVDEVIKERLEALVDSIRVEMRQARIRYEGLGVVDNGVAVTVKDPAKVETAREKIRGLDSTLELSEEGGRITARLTEKELSNARVGAVEQSLEIIRNRIDEMGTREPTIQRQGEDRVLVQVPGVKDPERLIEILKTGAKMTFHLLDPSPVGGGRVPPGAMLLPAYNADDAAGDGRPRTYLVKKKVEVSGESLIDAQPGFDSRDGQPVVNFRFDTRGGKKFADVTRANVGKPFAIVLDKKVITAPVIREPILGGSGQISGGFTVQKANDLALLLRAGALPAPITVLEQRSVGPGLGADSIAAGKIASVVGLLAVIVFMVVTYGRFGIYADVALLVNMVLIGASLSVLQATLTLPGIAGIVLTIGMAVDANVLVFERIREEIRQGRTPISAVDAGYSRAIKTIVDANVTTLIAAVLLFQFGSGPVRGFAVTLAIGIVTSMFTAIMLTRLMVVFWLRRAKPSTIPV